MPPSAKRSQKNRRETRRDPSPSVQNDSSPSRPAKRRRKAGFPKPSPFTCSLLYSWLTNHVKTQDPPASEPIEDDESLLTADQPGVNTNENDQLVSQITQHLLIPKEPVQASKDHANTIHEANKDGVKAYAKIAAQDWTYYVTQLAINIGRASDQAVTNTDGEHPEYVHIDLGPSKMISRQHACISFNSKEEKWILSVKGRNGVKIDEGTLRQGQQRALVSGEVVEIAGVEMMFVLPSEISPLTIHPMYHKRAGLPAPEAPHPLQAAPSSSTDDQPPSHGSAPSKLPHPIAPAPPDYKRPGTPPSVKKRTVLGANKTPQHSNPLLMTNSEVDLSKDDNRHIKPQYSYAQMITQAIMNAPEEKLNLNGIYKFIMDNYAYYRHQQAAGWQNSIRHNLSLNKAFDKVARSTDEPGKGMKWQIVAESREEMLRTAYKGGRGGHRGSSAPSSPSQLSYITQGPRDMIGRDPGSARKRKASPFTGSPPPKSAPRPAHATPDRGGLRSSGRTRDAGDDSPLPRTAKYSSSAYQAQSPTLASSYLQDESTSFATPAPHRVHPKLAPPSTAQRPSQHMPTSSPAPFWKYADIGSTPLKPAAPFDTSPSKHNDGIPQSSSPPNTGGKSPAASSPGPRRRRRKMPLGRLKKRMAKALILRKAFRVSAPTMLLLAEDSQ